MSEKERHISSKNPRQRTCIGTTIAMQLLVKKHKCKESLFTPRWVVHTLTTPEIECEDW